MAKNDPLAELAAVTPEELKRRACLVGQALHGMPKGRAEVLRYLIDESGHAAARIARAAKEAGVFLSDDVVLKHRRRECQCP